ncbi:ESPR domain-containing protein [Ferrigenium kumadai]
MNHIYRLVWGSLRNAWVVTHEHAITHGKDSIIRRMRRGAGNSH